MKEIITAIIILTTVAVFVFHLLYDRHKRLERHHSRRKEQRQRQLERNENRELYLFLRRRQLLQQYEQEAENNQTITYKGYFAKEAQEEFKK